MKKRRILSVAALALANAIVCGAQASKPVTTPPPSWSILVGDSIQLGANWRMWISSRRDGWVELFVTGKPGARVPVDAIVTPTATTAQTSFMRAVIDPAVIERFVTEADTALGPRGKILSSAEYKRWADSIDVNQLKYPNPVVRFSVGNPTENGTMFGRFTPRPGGFWMEWRPLLPRRYVNTYYQLTIGVGCINPGTLPPGGSSLELNSAQSDSLMTTLRLAVAMARRLRPSPEKIDEGAVRRRDEVMCAARPVSGNPIPHNPGRKAMLRAAAADVHVDLVIDSSGRVARATPSMKASSPLDSAERRVFMAEVTSTLKEWRFMPGRMTNGRAVSQQLDALVQFLPPSHSDGALSLLDSTALWKAIGDARVDSSDLLVVASRVPRGEESVSKFIMTRDSIRVHVVEGGPHCAMPIVFVNYPGASVRRLGRVLEQLIDGRWVVTYDLRGEGGSSPSPRNDYSIEAHVNDLSAVLDSLALPKVMLVSQAEGWKIAMTYAARHPERVAGTLTFGPADAHGMDERSKASWLDQLRGLAFGQRNDVPGVGSGASDSAVKNVILSDLRRADPTGLVESVDRMFAYDIAPSLLAYEGPKVIVGVPGVPGQPPRSDNYGVTVLVGPSGYATLTDPDGVVRMIDLLRTDYMARAGQRSCPW